MADFFDKFAKNSDKYLSELEDKFYEIADSAGTRIDIIHLKKDKDRALRELGSAVYRMYLKGKFEEDAIKKDCGRILDIDKKIKRVEDDAHEKKKERKHGKK